jgi:hypothetical protein
MQLVDKDLLMLTNSKPMKRTLHFMHDCIDVSTFLALVQATCVFCRSPSRIGEVGTNSRNMWAGGKGDGHYGSRPRSTPSIFPRLQVSYTETVSVNQSHTTTEVLIRQNDFHDNKDDTHHVEGRR